MPSSARGGNERAKHQYVTVSMFFWGGGGVAKSRRKRRVSDILKQLIDYVARKVSTASSH